MRQVSYMEQRVARMFFLGDIDYRMKKVLFVCLGNICRSPAAQAVMQHMVDEAGLSEDFVIDSAGLINYHEGELPDSRMRTHAACRGYSLTHLSRPVCYDDFFRFDIIVGMDNRNIDCLHSMSPTLELSKKIVRMSDFFSHYDDDSVPDPYYGGDAGFRHVLDLLEDACKGLLSQLVDSNETK